jgi:PAS domain S-box-containing protein
MKTNTPARQSTRLLVFILILFLVSISTVGYLYFQKQRDPIKREAGHTLAAVADMMVRQVVRWREERFAGANRILDSSGIASHVHLFFNEPTNTVEKRFIQDWMTGWHKNFGFTRVLLFDTNQQVRLAVPPDDAWVGPVAEQFALRALHTNQILVSDMHISQVKTGFVNLDVFVPLLTPGDAMDSRTPVGAMMFEISPHDFLYPTLQTWPIPSRTAEALLVRQEGDEVVFLSLLRHRTNEAMTLRRSVGEMNLPAAMAVRGMQGMFEGVDYRGVPVLTVTRPVPNSPWFIVVKEDQEEIQAPIRALARNTAILTGVLVLMASLGVGLLWRQRDLRFIQRELAAERELAIQERARQESERSFRVLFDQIQDGILVADPQTRRICFGNPAISRMLGYEAGELSQLSVGDIHPAADLPHVIVQFEQLVRGTLSVALDIPVKRKDGSIFYADISAKASDLLREGRLIGVFRDITERKQAQRCQAMAGEVLGILNQASESQDFIPKVLDVLKASLGVDAVGIRLQSGDDFPYVAQSGFYEGFVLAENSLLARDPRGGIIRSADGRVCLQCICGIVLSGKADPSNPFYTPGGSAWTNNSRTLSEPRDEDPRFQRRNRCITEGYLSIALVPIRFKRRIIGLLQINDRRENQFTLPMIQTLEGVAAHIGEAIVRRQAEEEIRRLNAELEQRVLERTAQFESANKELESFCYSVSHDLRAPLRGIDGWSLALLEDCGAGLDAQGRGYLDRVRSEVQRMGQLIDDLLRLSHVTRSEMHRKPVDLSAIAVQILDRLRETQPGRNVEIIVQSGLSVSGDSGLLEAAIANLLENAWKFTGQTAQARIEFGRTDMDGIPTFFVRDNGAGFDMAYSEKLFGPFQRMHRQTEFPGTGIGLATVQRIVNRHGGRIWAEAHVGQGAAFYFTLPEPVSLDCSVCMMDGGKRNI